MSGTGSPVAIDPAPPNVPPYIDSRLVITSIDSDGGTGAIIQGQDFTVSGTAEAFPAALDSGYSAPFSSNAPVYVFARPVEANGVYGPSQLLGTATLTDTGQTDGNYFGEELYSWSLSGLNTSTLPNGLYDLEAFQIEYTIFTQNGDQLQAPSVSNHPAFSYANVTSANTQSFGAGIDAGSADLSDDGRYVTYTVGSDVHVRDLQTGRDSVVTGGQPTPGGPYATIHPFQSNELSFANGNEEEVYSGTITAGNLTFGAIGSDHPYAVAGTQPYDINGYYNGYDAQVFPTVTDNTTGVTTKLNAEGIPIATSDNGDAVLSQGFVFNGLGDASPPYGYVVNYVGAAPTLTLDPVNGTNSAGDFAGDPLVTLTGTSDAIGQEVEIDVAAAQAGADPSQEYGTGVEAGLALVGADGTWHLTFDPAAYTPSASGLFIEASVSSAAGTPARTSQTVAVITTPPIVSTISAYAASGASQVGAGDTITIDVALGQDAPPVTVSGTPMLILSNGQEATYSAANSYSVGGFPFGFTQQILAFTYTPGFPDASGPLSVTGLDLDGGSIRDGADDPLTGSFSQSLGLTVQTAPVLQYVSTLQGFSTSSTTTNDSTPSVYGYAVVDNAGDVVTVFDGSTVLGSVTLPFYGQSYATYFSIPYTAAAPLGDGTHSLTAVLSVGNPISDKPDAVQSGSSVPLPIVVDTVPPPEAVSSLAVNGSDVVGLADQASGDVKITGTLTGPLLAGDTVEIALANGQTEAATATLPGNGFELDVSADDVAHFGVGGVVSAYVTDAAGNQSPTLAQPYTAASVRTIGVASATPADPLSSPSQQPSLSANGEWIAFDASGGFGESVGGGMGGTVFTPGLYVENLATGATTLAVAPPNAYSQLSMSGSALAAGGALLAYSGPSATDYQDQAYVKDFATGATTLVSQAPGSNGATPGDGGVYQPPSLSADGNTIAFADTADNLVAGGSSGEQVFVGTLVDGVYQQAVASAPDGGASEGTGSSFAPVLSADGGSVAFASTASNLLGTGTAAPPAGVAELYVKTLADNAATGQKTGSVTLVSASALGVAADEGGASASISGNGRYVVFDSSASNLLPSSAKIPAGVEEVYVKDIATGAIALVSQTAAGIVADSYSSDAVISADGRTVLFSSSADDLAPGATTGQQQVYAKNLDTGTLTLLSEPGAIPGDGSSQDPSLSADGTIVAFDSRADNLAPDADPATAVKYGEHVYATTLAGPVAATATVTNTDDSGAGSLRAALATAISGDTIDFAPSIAGGTITLASTLTVTNGVTIDGTGESITVDGNGAATVFTIDDSSAVAAMIEGLTIEDGKGQGAPASAAQPDLPGGAAVGGIDVKAGTLQLAHDSFTGNTATGGTGGNAATDKGAGGGMGGNAGGAIYVESGTALSASDLTFSSNTATGGVGGAGAMHKGTGGTGGAAAGGIYVDPNAVLSAAGLTFDANSATGGAGGSSGTSSGTPSGNPFYPGIGGSAAGAIYAAPHATATSTGASFTGNSATVGAGYYDSTFDPTPHAYADTDIGGSTGPVVTSGTAEDGYIVGGTVAYLNGSGQSTTTDSHGAFTLTGGSGPIILTGGTDSATGLAFTGTLTAPAGSTILSPLTTLVADVVAASGDASAAGIAAAQAAVVSALDLPSGIDLDTYDAEGALLDAGSDPTALAAGERVYAASAYLQGAEQAIDAAGGSGAGALQAVAQQLAAGQSVDLTDPATLIDQGGLTQPGAAAAALSVVSGTISAVQDQLANTTDPEASFVDITGGSIAVQQDGAAALAQAAAQGNEQAFDDAATNYQAAVPATLTTDDGQVTDDAAPCFCPGTLIMTDAGEVAVERLAVGDRVLTADGIAEPIVWIGRRSYAGRFIAGNHLMLPITIRAGAVADGVPHTDLRVSPGHGMVLDGHLVPAWRLVNGVTILQASAVEGVEYFHVELDRHAVLLANGAPAESFLDEAGCRGHFANAADFHARVPDASPTSPMQDRLEHGFALQRVQDRLADRAGIIPQVEPAGTLLGFVDVATPHRICGWAQDADSPEEPVELDILADGQFVHRVLANAYRADLRKAGVGSGCHAFDVTLPASLCGHMTVRRVSDRAPLAMTDMAEATLRAA